MIFLCLSLIDLDWMKFKKCIKICKAKIEKMKLRNYQNGSTIWIFWENKGLYVIPTLKFKKQFFIKFHNICKKDHFSSQFPRNFLVLSKSWKTNLFELLFEIQMCLQKINWCLLKISPHFHILFQMLFIQIMQKRIIITVINYTNVTPRKTFFNLNFHCGKFSVFCVSI